MEILFDICWSVILLVFGVTLHELAHMGAAFLLDWKNGGFRYAYEGIKESGFEIGFSDRKAKENEKDHDVSKNIQCKDLLTQFDFALVTIAGPISHALFIAAILYWFGDLKIVKIFAIFWSYSGINNLFANRISHLFLQKMGGKDGQQLCVLMALSNPNLTAKLMIPLFWRFRMNEFLNLPIDQQHPYWIKNGGKPAMSEREVKITAVIYYCSMVCIISAPLLILLK